MPIPRGESSRKTLRMESSDNPRNNELGHLLDRQRSPARNTNEDGTSSENQPLSRHVQPCQKEPPRQRTHAYAQEVSGLVRFLSHDMDAPRLVP